MPLEPYRRGETFWVRGRIEYDGRPITSYYRRSTGTSTEAGARVWIAEETDRQRRRHLVGDEAEALTFAGAVLLYPAKPAEAKYLVPILEALGDRPVASITPREVRELAAALYPTAATDTWRRQVLTPVSAVINNAHDSGSCPPIRIRGFSAQERIDQDRRRGAESRRERQPADREWLAAFTAEAGPYLSTLAEFMFETAARIGQAVALRPNDLDLPRGRVWLPASKGHPAQWVAISPAMVARLANLPARAPFDRKRGVTLPPNVFGYASRTGPLKAWRSACARAGIPYIAPHAAGRHGFYTEMRVRQGLDPVTAAKAGRWSNPALPDAIYAHSEADEREIRSRAGTNPVQPAHEFRRKARK
ncbi:tyrosine-type recombinase/integrase [Psychromarinibacter halotolerans]|uniref:Tyrosine-type recombinase/integrase n=1 Tax=Psychromarinibacter halotolerans TaxID=1775175 RepID=A0ABV7GYD4_9RHOB|nr:tyrosine-type recombinase/integrase [Psychromarinibacter halotolerans]MDF0598963.1 tyrosine-type recombinase/integrase [Psychromarinibacter halotolerans]